MARPPVFVLPGGFIPPVALLCVVPYEDEPPGRAELASTARRDSKERWLSRLRGFFTGDRRGVR